MAPEKKGDESEVKEDIQQSDHVLLKSHTSSSVLLPMASFETVKVIAKKYHTKESQTANPSCLMIKLKSLKNIVHCLTCIAVKTHLSSG